MKKILASSLVVLGAVILTGASFSLANAQAEGNPSLIQRIAGRFNLSQTDVEQVFDEARTERMNTNLDKLVENGKITGEQKEQIAAKQAEIRAEMEEINSLAPEERQARIAEIREEVKTWSEENGIKMPFGMGFMGPMGKGIKKGGMGGFMGNCGCPLAEEAI